MRRSAALTDFLNRPGPVVRLTIGGLRGSAPREIGATMFVRARGLHGTIGGGQMELRAIETARAMLRGDDVARRIDIPLGPEIGQCCGGHVSIDLKRMSMQDKSDACATARAAEEALPMVQILGAGHVGRALADLFQHLPVRAILIDQRPEEIARSSANVEKRISALPEHDIAHAPAGSAFIVLTHDHALDFLLVAAALGRGDAAYVGMIGSATKRAQFESRVRRDGAGLPTAGLTCPIGAGGSRDKRPAVIAAFVLAEVMAALTARRTARHPQEGDGPSAAVR